jgi:fibronectin-binding A domain protein
MIYFDTIGLKFLVEELKQDLINFKVNKIIQYDNHSFSLIFPKKNLFFQIKDSKSIVYIKDKKDENTNISSSFILSIKKYLDHSQLDDIKILNLDRIVSFKFKRINISGEIDINYLIFEIMGRHSNIFLLDKDFKIINIFNNNVSIENKRFYAINSKYEYFELDKKEIDFETIFTSPQEMIDKIKGIGNIFASDTYNNIEKRKQLSSSYKGYIFKNNNNVYLSYNKFSKFNNYEINEYNTLNEAINSYFEEFVNTSLITDKKKKIEKFLLNKIKKNYKILENIEKDIFKDSNFEEYRYLADLLASYIYLIKPRMDKIEVFDYNKNKNILIDLDPKKSPSDNLNLLYKKYRKAKKGLEFANERKIKILEDQKYLDEVLNFLIKENDYLGLEEIEDELGLKKKIENKKNKIKKRELLKYVYNGYEIFVGRNHTENNHLTFEKAKNNDIWLHVRDIPGSHVIIVTNKKKVDQDTLYYAAGLAALHSKGEGRKIIDYTERSNVKRTNKFGNVTFNNFKSIEV